ncbi:hypothetical protein Ssi03_63730 [Sphaerisporangium siamense]|uniref:DUF3027 domain-containing protein n=1 Tax=Sphaerisporangium siamense TaxID=795645 RepID=A0A7W7D523_9ACTN|nr:DUF3027 domain-containing protein [Sphaerisporangium siamense]MBB4700454.1 hypothetical protein [Sphaerisporangium siamense]GII88383.1 hypothetical protein Ssi03_63730 [Sphaerisporangium siamense]
MSRTRSRTFAVDQACAAAVEPARAAAEAIARPGEVGEHLGFEAEGERVVTHYFACLDRAYRGWRWAVTVARASRARNVTVSETALLPGTDALLPPAWVPWSERLLPGDLGVGDLLPTSDDDDRLAPGYTATDDDSDQQMIFEYGLGRARVLSAVGRDRAVHRWHAGDSGPHTPLAHAAPAQCSTCGFYWPLAGSLRLGFGVCANEFAPDDGKVVSADHGCGAHSEAVATPQGGVEHAVPILDDLGYDLMEEGAPEAGSVAASDGEEGSEPLGHS